MFHAATLSPLSGDTALLINWHLRKNLPFCTKTPVRALAKG